MDACISEGQMVINSNDLRALEVPLSKGDPYEMICSSSDCIGKSDI